MFDKFKKKNNSTSQGAGDDNTETIEDDFFKNDEKPVAADDDFAEDGQDTLADDLKAFTDDLQKTDKDKELIGDEGGADIAEIKKPPKTPLASNKNENEEKWSMKRRNSDDDEGDWLNKDYEEGELAVDVYQDKDNVYVKSTIAGVSVEDIDISLHNDMLTIRGKREQEKELKGVDYLYQECYWGSFSRSIILPVEVKADKINAYLRDGILTVVLPKVKTAKNSGSKIKVKEK